MAGAPMRAAVTAASTRTRTATATATVMVTATATRRSSTRWCNHTRPGTRRRTRTGTPMQGDPTRSAGRTRSAGHIALKFVKPDVELVKQHYDEHKERPFFGGLVDFLSGGAVAAMVFQGENVIAAGRKMIGSTKPSDSAPGTIRGDFGITVGRNIIHGSDGAEAAAREIGLWFSESELVDWKQTQDVHLYE